MTPKMVIFDCDGVLVETESITDRVLSEYFSGLGPAISPEEVHELFAGGTMEGAGEEAARRGAILPADWLNQIYTRTFAALREGVEVFEGLFGVLDQLDALGIATAIASNGPMGKMEITLTPSGLWERFDGRIYSGREHGSPKPAPDLLLMAARAANVNPADCVMIDDTKAGTRAAKAAGMAAIGFAAASNAEKLREEGVPVAMHMAEVAELLGLGEFQRL